MVYAVGDHHVLRPPCQLLLRAGREGRVDLATTPEVVQEFAHVRARRSSRADAVDLARAWAAALEMYLTAAEDLRLGLDLFERYPRLNAFDAVLAAVALNRSAEALVSADQGYAEVVGLRWIDPATPDLDALVRV